MSRRRFRAAWGALALVVALASREGRGGILEDFEESYALYEACVMALADHDVDGDADGADFLRWQRGVGLTGQTNNSNGDADRSGTVNGIDLPLWRGKFGTSGGLPAPLCFKLYLDPQGIVDGQVTAFVDSPHPGFGDPRFVAADFTGVFQTHPEYEVSVLASNVLDLPGRQRIETTLRFTAKNPTNPPTGQVTIFGYQVGDQLPGLGLEGVQAGFTFGGGGFVALYDTDTGVTTTLPGPLVPDVMTPPQPGLLQAGDPILAIDLDPPTSRSNYPAGQPPINVGDANPTSAYGNLGKRQTGFITRGGGALTVAQSMRFVTSFGPPAGDPTSWQLYGTNASIASPDNSDGNLEPWTLIASGNVTLPTARGVPGPLLTFPNLFPFQNYRIVFPTIKDFRAATAMQVAEVQLFSSPSGMPPNLMQQLIQPVTPPHAIMFPTPQADSPPAEGPEKLLDGAPYTKHLNFGRENAGIIVTPSVGATIVASFVITTANDFVGRDPQTWELYGTNVPIVSENFGQGVSEPWEFIDSGTLALPDARLEAGPLVTVDNTMSFLSYRLVFPSVRAPIAPGVNSVQIGDVQFYGIVAAPVEPVPEPASLVVMVAGVLATPRVRSAPGSARGSRDRVRDQLQPPAGGRG
jgi:hypothetical protein